jgi:hypothetical protein
MAQAATATAQAAASPSPATTAEATSTVENTQATPEADVTVTAGVEITATSTPEGTPTPRPIPTGTPPAPLDVLFPLNYLPVSNILVKRDVLNLDGDGHDEVLLTASTPHDVVTGTYSSAIEVLTYDDLYREWNPSWVSTGITGTASPLPSANQAGGVNGGDLLRTGDPILLIRTTTLDNNAHLAMWRFDRQTKKADFLKMVPAGGGAEKDAIFDAELDVNVADINDDGVYEVVADNLAGVQVWTWDGSRYVPEGGLR